VRVVDHAALTRRQDRDGLDDARGGAIRREERDGPQSSDEDGAADEAPYPGGAGQRSIAASAGSSVADDFFVLRPSY
jgi:hypothetical protein